MEQALEEGTHAVTMRDQKMIGKSKAKQENTRRVNAKVSITYDTEAASRLAHDKILSEQLKDPKCIKIATLLEKGDSIESKRTKLYFFWHEGLLMRRFIPLKSEVEKAAEAEEKRKEPQNPKTPFIWLKIILFVFFYIRLDF